MEHTYTRFYGNIDFYNDPRYRAANLAFYSSLDLLKQCGMSHEQALVWVSAGGVEENEEDEQ